MVRHKTGLLLVVSLLALTGACGSGGEDDDGSGSSPSGDASSAGADGGPLVRLTKVVYNGKTQYEFTYGPDGEPKEYQIFHPVTGEPQNRFVIDQVDADGHVIEETVTKLPDGTTSTKSLSYDDDGRLVSVVRHTGSGNEETTYTWADGQVTMKSPSTKNVYHLDSDGNITKEVSTFSGRTTTTTYVSYDDGPNPFTLTGGMAAQIWSANNATKWAPPDGCEYTVELTYDDDGRPVSSHAEGCASYVHDYVYEYAQF